MGLGAASALVLLYLAYDWWHCLPPGQTTQYVGRQTCAECHGKQQQLWLGSDHERAMDLANSHTVSGDFNDREFTHFGVTSKMFRRNGKYFMHTDGPDGRMADFEICYTFGIHPLQQYLVAFPDGRLQCLPLAWDTEGKRWFHLYPNEPIPFTDELHWTKPLQNWNYMCADCHSTNLQKNFDLPSNTYHTTFSEINVSCETCHGPGSLHTQLARSHRVFWDRRYGYGLPPLKGADSHVQIEACAPCHARRRTVFPGFKPGEKFLDYYLPEMLDTESYYPDGQIRDEDYEYSSFLQSKMYHNNVRCSDCHDPHTQRVKFKDGPTIRDNRLCGQCHLPAKFDTPNHHHHPDSSKPGTLCIQCHMPTTNYMVVDPRLDHSIRIPRPDLTLGLGIPNACNKCHNDPAKKETPQWAEDKVRQWYGPLKGPPHFAYAIAAGRQGKPEGPRLLDAVVRRKDVSEIVRASALMLLGRYGAAVAASDAQDALRDPDALVRVAAVHSLQDLPPEQLLQTLSRMLRDPVRAVRAETARLLVAVPPEAFAAADRVSFDAALAEYLQGQESVADQSAAHLNFGVIHTSQGHPDQAVADYRTALRLDPHFIPARVNLAMLYDQLGRKKEAEGQFHEILKQDSKLGEIHYSLGLLLAEDETRLPDAAEHLSKAAELLPDRPRVAYNLGLALQKLGRLDDAEKALKRASQLAPDPTEAVHALALLYIQRKQWPQATTCAEHLIKSHPEEPAFAALLKEIRQNAAQHTTAP
jgi:tetratricopeptide (TPR) repeat protein